MLHKGREIEVAKDVLIARLDGLCYLSRLLRFRRQLAHLVDQHRVGVPGIQHRPVEAWKYLGGISGDQPGEVFGVGFHAVVIDELRGRELAEAPRHDHGRQLGPTLRSCCHFSSFSSLMVLRSR